MEQLTLFPDTLKRFTLCHQVGTHVWSRNGFNQCDCGEEIIGPWNCPETWLPGTPIKDNYAVTTR